MSVSAFAQTVVNGTVKDTTGQPVPYALVTVDGTYSSSVTDANGVFHVTVQGTPFCVTVQSLGYEKFNQCYDQSTGDLNIALKQSVYMREQVIVTSTRINQNGIVAHENIGKDKIQSQNFGQDLPYILNNQTSVVTTSDAGNGIGYTGLRIRGTDPTRINVTINGIPVNDAESQGTFWVDIPDIASSTENIQLQRGVGTSTNGAGAFGGSLNLQTELNRPNPYGEMMLSGGSFNSWRATAKAGTGIIKNRWSFDVRMSQLGSDGFIDRGRSDLRSWYASGAYYGNKLTVKAITFSGRERTYQCWYGVPEDSIKAGNYTYNPAGIYNDTSGAEVFYNNQVDDYGQDYYQLHFIYQPKTKWAFNLSLFATKGKGYYEEYLQGQDLNAYGYVDTSGSYNVVVRRRWLDNWYYGSVFSYNYNSMKGTLLSVGGAFTQYDGKHFGEVIWATGIPGPTTYQPGYNLAEKHYYDDDAQKTDANIYARVNQYAGDKLMIYADLQARSIQYSFTGKDSVGAPLPSDTSFLFFNPKAGLNYAINNSNNVYAYFGMANKEPNRDDFVNSTSGSRPSPESLIDIEFGWNYAGSKIAASVNFYDMIYKDQLVLTGKVNDVGSYTRENVASSYRRGVEITLGYNVVSHLNLTGNLTLSENKITEFHEFIDDYDNGGQLENTYNNTDISFSPSVISAGIISWNAPKYTLSLTSKYVGSQFLDNTMQASRMIDAYFLLNFGASWTPIKSEPNDNNKLGGLTLGLQVNNLLNKMYSANGYTYGYVYGGMNRYNYYYPQAGINVMGMVTFKFQ